jgi:predicted DNA-binding transcriptional regulator YafY
LSANLYNRLWENPLADDQVLQQQSDGWWKLTCRIRDSQGLRLFLLSNAADIEVKKPAILRAHVHDTLQRALSLYGG